MSVLVRRNSHFPILVRRFTLLYNKYYASKVTIAELGEEN